MPRQANGQYVAPANTSAISGTVISSTAFNTLQGDVGTEISNSLDRNGRSAMAAALPMGTFKITGMGDPTNAQDAATKNYVDASAASTFSTGDIKMTLKTAADAGWLLFDDGTFGSSGSGASNRANNDTLALFTLLFNNVSDTYAPLLTANGGVTTRSGQTAAQAWVANCRMTLPKTLGRAWGVAGAGAGLTGRGLGSTNGAETQTLITANLPPYTPGGSVSAPSFAQPISWNITTSVSPGGTYGVALQLANATNAGGFGSVGSKDGGSVGTPSFTGSAQGGLSTAFSIMPPMIFTNAMIKL